jgi:hypothetical protein
MADMKLSKKVKEIVAPGCGFRLKEEDDGIIIEIVPRRRSEKAGICAPKFDAFNNLIGCKSISCGAGCRMCCYEYDDGYCEYYCKCGPCPPKDKEVTAF